MVRVVLSVFLVGDALYVNNTYTQRDVEIRSYGKILGTWWRWRKFIGSDGNSGGSLNCFNTNDYTSNNGCTSGDTTNGA